MGRPTVLIRHNCLSGFGMYNIDMIVLREAALYRVRIMRDKQIHVC